MPAGLDWQAAGVSLWTVETGRAIDRLEVRRRVGEAGPVALAPQSLSTTRIGAAPTAWHARLGLDDRQRGHRARSTATRSSRQSASRICSASTAAAHAHRPAIPCGCCNGRFGAIGGVTATPNGDIYFFTQNNETWAAGRDVLVRLRVVK